MNLRQHTVNVKRMNKNLKRCESHLQSKGNGAITPWLLYPHINALWPGLEKKTLECRRVLQCLFRVLELTQATRNTASYTTRLIGRLDSLNVEYFVSGMELDAAWRELVGEINKLPPTTNLKTEPCEE